MVTHSLTHPLCMSNERVRKEKQDLEALCCLDYIFIVYYYITIGL